MSQPITLGEVLELPADDPRAALFEAMLLKRAEAAKSGRYLTAAEMRARLDDPTRFECIERSIVAGKEQTNATE